MRKSIRIAFVISMVLMLSACGYKLRGSGDSYSLAGISPLYISGLSKTDGLYRTIRDYMRSADVVLTENASEAAETLAISSRKAQKNIHSVGARGKVLEYELIEGFRYKLGPALTVDERSNKTGTVEVRRIYTNPETEVLGRKHEENTIRRDMWQQLASSLMQRLSRQVR